MKILFVATEASPYVAAGGFASVVGYLSKSLVSLGHDVRVFIPKFGFLDEKSLGIEVIYEGLRVPTGDENTPELVCNVKYLVNKDSGVTFYFLENQEYYEKRANVYSYSDDPTRFALLSRGALEFIRTGIFVPDVIHCNDWHTGALPNYLETEYKKDPILKNISTLFTIHNLRFQGTFDHRYVSEMDYDDGRSPIDSFFSSRINKLNFMKRGIIYSDIVNTVSRSYSREILTPDFGEGLDKLLLELKGKLFGIVNGLDYEEYNPATDRLIENNYDINSISLREKNKSLLQEEFGLPIKEDVLLLGYVGRLDNMKGIDLMVETLHHVMKDHDVQFVQCGGGDGELVSILQGLKDKYPNRVGIHPFFDVNLPRLIFAGSDCILYPSRFEPCGIVQIEAMRYGAIPIVRDVGGLSDTVENFNVVTGKGTGLVFKDFDVFSLYGQIIRAIELHHNKKVWRKIQKNAMSADFSWSYSAREYEKLYEKVVQSNKKK